MDPFDNELMGMCEVGASSSKRTKVDKEFEKLPLVDKYLDDTTLHPSKVDTTLKNIMDTDAMEWREF